MFVTTRSDNDQLMTLMNCIINLILMDNIQSDSRMMNTGKTLGILYWLEIGSKIHNNPDMNDKIIIVYRFGLVHFNFDSLNTQYGLIMFISV